MAQLRTLLARSLNVNNTILLDFEEVVCPKSGRTTCIFIDVRPYQSQACFNFYSVRILSGTGFVNHFIPFLRKTVDLHRFSKRFLFIMQDGR